MASHNPQVPWTDEQWELVTQTVRKEAARARVAASFLPLVGPLPPDADFVRNEKLTYNPPCKHPESEQQESQTMAVNDRTIIPLATLQVKVHLRGAQMADPHLSSALEMFRRAANVLARLEDAIVFKGQTKLNEGTTNEMPGGPPACSIKGLPAIWKVTGGVVSGGLFGEAQKDHSPFASQEPGQILVQDISARIGELEARGHFGPFAVVLGEKLFLDAQSPANSLVLPSDRIIPFLGGGPLLRSSTLPKKKGIVVALGAAPVELIIATDVSVGFLQVTTDPHFVFRVYEKMAVRIKEDRAVEGLGCHPESEPSTTTSSASDSATNPTKET